MPTSEQPDTRFAACMQPSFAVEKTMGRLAKWLRLMGFDTLLETDYPKGMFARHIGPERVFLTRTRRALGSHSAFRTVFLHANEPMDQLAEVIKHAALRREELRPFSRCLQCNEPSWPSLRQRSHAPCRITCWKPRSLSVVVRNANGCFGPVATRHEVWKK